MNLNNSPLFMRYSNSPQNKKKHEPQQDTNNSFIYAQPFKHRFYLLFAGMMGSILANESSLLDKS